GRPAVQSVAVGCWMTSLSGDVCRVTSLPGAGCLRSRVPGDFAVGCRVRRFCNGNLESATSHRIVRRCIQTSLERPGHSVSEPGARPVSEVSTALSPEDRAL